MSRVSWAQRVLFVVMIVIGNVNAIPISIFVPSRFQATDDSSDLVGPTITVDTSEIFTLSRMYMQPIGGDLVGLMPYYYRTAAAWVNSDGTPMLVNGVQLTSEVYVGIIYDNNLNVWRDVSGVAIDIDGKKRTWSHGVAYFSCTQSFGGTRFLQAFRSGSVPASVVYDAVVIGAGVFPQLKSVSELDIILLANPRYGVLWRTLIDRAQVGVVVAKENILNAASAFSSSTVPSILDPLKKSDTNTVVVTFECGRSLIDYHVSCDDVYEIVSQLPTKRTSVVQSFLVVPTQPLYPESLTETYQADSQPTTAGLPSVLPVSSAPMGAAASAPTVSAVGAPSSVPFSFDQYKQFVPTQLGLVLADYYVKVGSLFIALEPARDVSGAVISSRFRAWKGSIDRAHMTTPKNTGSVVSSLEVSADKRQLIIKGYPYFADAASSEANCYFGNMPALVDGINTGFVVAAHEKFFQGRLPVFERCFQGQVSFYMSSLRRLRSITKEEILGSPYYVYPLALNFSTQRQIAQLPPDDNFIPVSFKTSENQLWHGMIVLKTGFFAKGKDTSTYKTPHEYYKVVPSEEKFQLWYTPNNTIPMQVNNDFIGTTITEMNMISLDEYNLWPAGLVDIFKSAAIKFVGQKMKEKTPSFWNRIAAVFKPSAVEYEKAPA